MKLSTFTQLVSIVFIFFAVTAKNIASNTDKSNTAYQNQQTQKTIYFANGKIKYQGQWQNKKMHGKGKLYYQSGNLRYHGFFSKGKLHGTGTYCDLKGNKYYQGHWHYNKRQGKGKMFYENGAIRINGIFQDDKLVSGTRYTKKGKPFFVRNLGEKFLYACKKEWNANKQKNTGKNTDIKRYKKGALPAAIDLYNQNIQMVENGDIEIDNFKNLTRPTLKVFHTICPSSFTKHSKNLKK